MKPQLTVLIPLLGLGAYLILKPSGPDKGVEDRKTEVSDNKSVSDTLMLDSLAVERAEKTIHKKEE